MKPIALSWPAAPHQNAFVDTTCDMLSNLGFSVRPGNANLRNTALQKADLFVVHWPDEIFRVDDSKMRFWYRIARALTNLFLLKCRGTRVLWFVHNLQPHDLSPDRLRAWDLYFGALARLADGWITLSPSTAPPAKLRCPALARKPHGYIWHPSYGDAYGQTDDQARTELGLSSEAIVFGHAGLLRLYKNLVPLAAEFEDLAPDNAVLLLMGAAQETVNTHLSKMVTQRLDYREGLLSLAEFDCSLKAMDVFLAPYENFLHSGALVHALSRGCVVVAPRAPFTGDLAEVVGDEWVILYDEHLDANVLARAARAARQNQGRKPNLTFMEPDENLPRLRTLLCDIGIKLPKPRDDSAHSNR